MSVRTMARVWADSKHSGTELLMLLAIADFADDEGNAYPAVPTLAKKCRMGTRNANFILTALKTSGELEVRANEGPKGTNRYRIVLGAQGTPLKRTSAPKAPRPLKPASPPTPEAHFTPPEAGFTLKPTSSPPEAGFLQPLKPTSDEPSLNHQEPSDTSLSRPLAPKFPNCPHDLIVQSYHAVLTELPRVKLMDSKGRKDKIAEFWRWVLTSTKSDGTRRATTAEEAQAWIRAYFERARSNDFLMGRSNRSEAHSTWRCDFDFLLTEKGKIQVVEKTEAAE